MTNQELFSQAIADAKAVRDAAVANAKAALEETFTPKIMSMLSAKLNELEEDMEKEGKKVVKKFRLGGRLINKDNADKYIVLASGYPPKQLTWSVQVSNSELFYKQKVEDIIDKNEDDVKALKDENKKLKDEKKELVLKYNELVEKYSKLKNSIKK